MKKSLTKQPIEFKRQMLPLNLQLFADGDEGEGDSKDAENDTEDEGDGFTPPANQSELDAAINKAVQTALANQKKKTDKAIEEAVAEKLKREKDLSQLSEEDRAKREADEEREAFEKEKAEFELEKLVVQTEKDLISKSLPSEFAKWLAVAGDNDQTLENIKTFEAEFKKSVAEAVKVSLRQDTPGSGGGGNTVENAGAKFAEQSGATASGKLFD